MPPSSKFLAFYTFLCGLLTVAAFQPLSSPNTPTLYRRVNDVNGQPHPDFGTKYHFDQMIDHGNPSLGKFKMEYFTSWQFYRPGGPIILEVGGEGDLIRGAFGEQHIAGALAKQEHGAIIALEHRFFGQSQPFGDLKEESLKYLTIQQAIDDLEYFAKNVVLPMPNGHDVKPDKTPWILVGGSYPGALTAWTMVNKPGLFWAGYASSAVVNPIIDFWTYYLPAQEYLPRGCSSDINRVISRVDEALLSGDGPTIRSIKEKFGLSSVQNDDFVSRLREPMWSWQQINFKNRNSGTGKMMDFCRMLEDQGGKPMPAHANGVGLDRALDNWGKNFTAKFKSCDAKGTCGGSHDPSKYDTSGKLYSNGTGSDWQRAWKWMTCNEMGFFLVGPPNTDKPRLVSSTLRVDYEQRSCAYNYPKSFTLTSFPNANETIAKYRGWDIKVDRLFFVNGIRDPWRESTMAATRNGTKSTPLMPILLTDAHHCDDMGDPQDSPSLKDTRQKALATFSSWIADWPGGNPPRGGGADCGGTTKLVAGALSGYDEAERYHELEQLVRNSYIVMGILGVILVLCLCVIALLVRRRGRGVSSGGKGKGRNISIVYEQTEESEEKLYAESGSE